MQTSYTQTAVDREEEKQEDESSADNGGKKSKTDEPADEDNEPKESGNQD